ncbi:MAG: four helix bundle protein [Bacteroidales bacterium]|jgi:four helix bundle protein|nr:four helix bundle protein [Bacteroidales bacterium]
MEEQENKQQQGSFFRFEDLRVYHKSLDYYQWLRNQVKDFGEFDFKVIGKPLLKAAANISINIAEGSARHKSQFVIFLKDAKTALRECVVWTAMAGKDGLLSEEQLAASNEQLAEMTKMLGAMVISLQRNGQRENRSEYQQEQSTSTDLDSGFEY